MKYEVYSDIKSGDVTINQNGQPLIRIDGAAALTQREVDELVTICKLASDMAGEGSSKKRPVRMRKSKEVQKMLPAVPIRSDQLESDNSGEHRDATDLRPNPFDVSGCSESSGERP